MKRFLVICDTAWCGTQETFRAIAEDELDNKLEDAAQLAAYDNFISFSMDVLEEYILPDLFPDVEEYTDSMRAKAEDVVEEYYSYTIEEWDEERPEKEWSWYEWLYDATGKYGE